VRSGNRREGSTRREIEGLGGEGADTSFGVCEALQAGRRSPACSLAEPRVPVCQRKAPGLVWIAEGGWGCGQVDEDTRTRLESRGCGGGCGQVDENPSARLQSGGCVGRSTKDPRARLRSGGWQWGVWYRPKPSCSLGELRVQWPVRRRPYARLESRGRVRVDETPHARLESVGCGSWCGWAMKAFVLVCRAEGVVVMVIGWYVQCVCTCCSRASTT
jgi:hypothetical protein